MRPGYLLLILLTACPRPSVLGPQSFDDADVAERYYAMKRQGSADPQHAYAVARAQMRRMQRFSITSTGNAQPANGNILQWTFLGPGNIGGRTRTLIIDPTDPNVMYAGGVSGGVWKTVNAGAQWDAIGDELVNLAVNSMAMDPRDHNVLYAGTGEGYFREEVRGTGLPLRGNGIFVTRDSGASWQQLASTSSADFQYVNDLKISMHDSQRIYAATRTGVWRSTDAGQNWTRVLPVTVKGGCLDLAQRLDTNGDTLFASCGTFEQATVYRATNAETDSAWTSVLSEANMGRTTLAIAPSRPSTIYALAATNVDQTLLAVYRSDSNGDSETWTERVRGDSPDTLSDLLLTNPITATQRECNGGTNSALPMGWYCNTIAVDPVDPERVFAAGVDLFRSDDGGRSWGVASYWWSDGPSHLHADQHNIVFDRHYDGAANQTMFLTNDGGVYRTDNAALASVATGGRATCAAANSKMVFTPLDHNYGVTQFYNGAVFPDGRRFLAGAQDNATLIGGIAHGTNWDSRIGGDGGYVAVDPVDPNHVYAEFQNANIYRSDDGGDNFTSSRRGLNDDFLFVTPFVIDANHPTRLWTGGTHIWRTENRGDQWTSASKTLSGHVSAIAVAPRQSDRVVAGTTDGAVYINTNATTASSSADWTRVQPREGWVSSLTFDPNDASILYATYAGFGGKHVWRSSDAGTTWTSIDGDGDASIPDIPVHCLAVDPARPDRLYLGTDLGVFVTTDGGLHWSAANNGFAAVVTEWVTIAQGERGPALYAFTHGRGAWRAELVPQTRRRAVRPQ